MQLCSSAYTLYVYICAGLQLCIHSVCMHMCNMQLCSSAYMLYVLCIYVGLARTIYMHHIWPYIWWFPCQKHRICTVCIEFWPTLHICNIKLCRPCVYLYATCSYAAMHTRCMYTYVLYAALHTRVWTYTLIGFLLSPAASASFTWWDIHTWTHMNKHTLSSSLSFSHT